MLKKQKIFFLNRRQFFLSIPLLTNLKIKKHVEVIVEFNNFSIQTYVEEKQYKEIFYEIKNIYPDAYCLEIIYSKDKKYLLKKYDNIVPLIFGVSIWILQEWDNLNKVWNQNGELFCFIS